MNVTVTLNTDIPLVNITEGNFSLDLEEYATMTDVIEMIDAKNPGFKEAVVVGTGEISKQFLIFINGDNIEHKDGLATGLNPDDVINVIPAIAGG
jgi:molybdopterin converting factor small subunit